MLARATAFALSLLLAVSAAAIIAPQPAEAGNCGVKLVLKNPDLQASLSGEVVASGLFFIQFQAIGDGAERVKTFTFSFGEPIPDALQSCTTPRWITGAYIQDYRGDYTPEDGFFVPINTTLVPDGTYGAAVHAYDEGGNEIGRFFLTARVANGCQMARCQDRTPAQIQAMDKVQPWPRVLPGDGVQTNDIGGLTVEFAEPVTEVHAFVNGNETTLKTWAGVPMDDDFQPGNDHTACGAQPNPVCVKRVWGPAYQADLKVAQNDIVRVTAVDLNGNPVEKIIHLLDPTQGGIVSGDKVDIDINVDATTRSVGPGETGQFTFAFTSLSQGEAHVNLPVTFDDTKLDAKFTPDHVVVRAGERATADLTVTGKEGVTSGTFLLDAKPTWRSAGEDVSKEFPLSFIIGTGEGGNLASTGAAEGNATAKAVDDGGTPAPGALVVLSGLLLAAVLWSRRKE